MAPLPVHVPLGSTNTFTGVPKVSTDMQNDSAQTELTPRPTRLPFPESHRGWDKLGSLREINRKKIADAPSPGVFWKEIKRMADPKLAPISVTAVSLKEVFEKRLNTPQILPTQFDTAQHSINKILAGLLPETTEDKTPEGFFSVKWNVDDMGRLKDHLRKQFARQLGW